MNPIKDMITLLCEGAAKKIKPVTGRIHTPYWIRSVIRAWRYLFAEKTYNQAVQQAEETMQTTGDRTYIIKGQGHKLLLVNRKYFRRFKKMGIIKPTATILDLQQQCFYCTSYPNGKDPMPADVVKVKKQQAIDWLINR